MPTNQSGALIRLDKFISNATDYSRSQIKQLVKQGDVLVDGEPVRNNALKIPDNARVSVSGCHISTPSHRYFMLHKPAGVVSVTRDQQYPTAIDLMVDEARPESLQIAGRLDIDTTGLLLITDDGAWNHRVTSPRRLCPKTYAVTVADTLQLAWVKTFNKGIWLEGEKRRCLPATLEILDNNNAMLTIHEGKFHQVKRMFETVGTQVTALHRQSVGNITLDEHLAEGEYRPLTNEEVLSIDNHTPELNP